MHLSRTMILKEKLNVLLEKNRTQTDFTSNLIPSQ